MNNKKVQIAEVRLPENKWIRIWALIVLTSDAEENFFFAAKLSFDEAEGVDSIRPEDCDHAYNQAVDELDKIRGKICNGLRLVVPPPKMIDGKWQLADFFEKRLLNKGFSVP